jgi:Na+-driven multidrug efflux pump
MNALIGAGDTRRSMWISLIWQWAFFLPLAFVVGPVLGFGLLSVWIVNGFYRVGQSISCGTQWASRKWADIRI